MDPRQKLIDRIATLAKAAFVDHQINRRFHREVFRHFYCAKPGTGTYAFNITTFPGRLVVTGDIGTLVVERVEDMFQWAPKAVHSIQYFEEKVPLEFKTRQYDPELVTEWLLELQTAEGTESELAKEADELMQFADEEPFFWSEVSSRSEITEYFGGDWPDFTNYTPSFLWCREAVKWFFANYRAEDRQPAEDSQA